MVWRVVAAVAVTLHLIFGCCFDHHAHSDCGSPQPETKTTACGHAGHCHSSEDKSPAPAVPDHCPNQGCDFTAVNSADVEFIAAPPVAILCEVSLPDLVGESTSQMKDAQPLPSALRKHLALSVLLI